MGSIQYWNAGMLIRIEEIPDPIRRWYAEWRAGRHPDYDPPKESP